MFDASELVGTPNTFLLNIHPHTWRDPEVSERRRPRGRAANTNSEGGQVVIVRGGAKCSAG
ncbi:MAG: hypothetical protein WKG07_06890 [Hymenobacter sp.]